MTDEQFFEISERLRQIESRLLAPQGDRPMLIEQLKGRMERLFDKAHANVPSGLSRTLVQRVRAVVLANLDGLKSQAEQFFDNGDFAGAVDFVLAFARGNVGKVVPWYLRPFVSEDKLLTQLGTWLKANAGLFREGIGELPPTK